MRYAVHSRSFAAPAISRPGALRFGGPVASKAIAVHSASLVCCDVVATLYNCACVMERSLRVDLFYFKTGKRLDNLLGIEKVRPPTDFKYRNFFGLNKTSDLPDWAVQFQCEFVCVE